MLVTFQEHQVCQHLVPHSSPVWSHEDTTVAKHTFNRCRCSRCTEDFLKQTVLYSELCFLLHSFPRICREASALLTYEAQVVVMVIPARDYLRFLIQGQKRGLLDYFARPRPRTASLVEGTDAWCLWWAGGVLKEQIRDVYWLPRSPPKKVIDDRDFSNTWSWSLAPPSD